MDQAEDYFLSHNKLLEEKLDYCIHNIEARLDKLYERDINYDWDNQTSANKEGKRHSSSFSKYSFYQFKAPYIIDFKKFSGPDNNDVRQIRQLKGTEKIDEIIKSKSWSTETKKQLDDAVLDYYAQSHIVELIKQKNILVKQETSAQNRADIDQKLSLIEEQTEQVRARKVPQIFVPDDRNDPNIDWCAISARLSSTHHDAQDCRLLWSNQLHWTINNGDWTREEDVCLLNAVQKFAKNDWDSVAKELNSSRLPWQCCSRYQQEFTVASANASPAPINDDDTEKIVEVINLCRIGNFVPWNQVMYFIKYHTLAQVKYQWHKLLAERTSNDNWYHHEDVQLLRAVEKFGEKDWNRIANFIPGRSNKSCRERYTMRLKYPKRAIGNWKRKEDEAILALIERFGTNWPLISSKYPDRNGHQIRSRYELLKKDSKRIGPMKYKRLYRNREGQLVAWNRRSKLSSELEVDEKLRQIFSTYQGVKPFSKSLVCRSAQDEFIYQNLKLVIQRALLGGNELSNNLMSRIIEKAFKERVSSKYEIFPPCVSTIIGYKAWTTQQDYLKQFEKDGEDIDPFFSSPEYDQILKIVMSLFLWPAILTRMRRPNIEVDKFHVGSIIEKDSKNLYKIREIQKRLTSFDPHSISGK